MPSSVALAHLSIGLLLAGRATDRKSVPVIVTVVPTVAPVAEQVRNAALSVIVGVAGTVNALSKTTVIVLPAASAPPDVGVKPTAHEAVTLGVCGVPAKVTAVTAVVAIVTFTGSTVLADENYIRESILNPQAKLVAGYQPQMPTFQGLVNEEGVMALLEYVKSMRKSATPVP